MASIQPNVKTSEETAAGTLTPTDLFRIVQGTGTTDDPYVSRKVAAGALSSYFAGDSDTSRVKVINVTTTTYTAQLTDAGGVTRCNNAATVAVTIPAQADVAYITSQVLTFRQVGDGQVTFTAASGVTFNLPDSMTAATRALGSVVMFHLVDDDEWDVTGDLSS